MTSTVKYIRQEWQVCEFEWGLDDNIVTTLDNGVRLIYVNIDQCQETGELTHTAVKIGDLAVYKGESGE